MNHIKQIEIQEFQLWKKLSNKTRALYSFSIDITARCNLNCRHCYINLPANDQKAKARELSLKEIENIADQAVSLGAVWVLLTGGEPLLRHDFAEIYLMLKRKGLLVSIFTNATLIHPDQIALFKKYSPRDIEVTIYGASQKTYEAVTRVPGSYRAFVRGLDALLAASIPIRLKAMALRSNLEDINAIADFGRKYTKDFYRFDPVLHLRYDRNEQRNQEICTERLTPAEIVHLERSDQKRIDSLNKDCDVYLMETMKQRKDDHLFNCGTGMGSFSVAFDGTFRLCASLWAPGTTVNLREVSLKMAWEKFVLSVRGMRVDNPEYLNTCGRCPLVNLCLNCPAHAYLETGKMDAMVPYFCQVAHARAEALQTSIRSSS